MESCYTAAVEMLISSFHLFSAHGTLNLVFSLEQPPKTISDPGFDAPHMVLSHPCAVLPEWHRCAVKTQLAEHFQDKQRIQFTI